MEILLSVGFTQISVAPVRYDVFGDAPSASSALDFGTMGIVFSARKPAE